jgi:hypothetical protein
MICGTRLYDVYELHSSVHDVARTFQQCFGDKHMLILDEVSDGSLRNFCFHQAHKS